MPFAKHISVYKVRQWLRRDFTGDRDVLQNKGNNYYVIGHFLINLVMFCCSSKQ